MSRAFPNDSCLTKVVTADPGQPRPNATIPYWLHNLHPLSNHRSSDLPQHADVVVIGSGITGLTLAKTLLENDPTIRITVLEARSVCSGATGRNGGHLVAYGGAIYGQLKKQHGRAMATKIVEFTFRTIRRTRAIMEESPRVRSNSEFRTLTRIRTFGDQESLDEARHSVAEFVQDNPQYEGLYRFVDDQKILQERYNVHGVVGAVLFEAAGLWPYRFVMGTWDRLLRDHPSRLTIEAQTLVTAVSYESKCSAFPYVVQTQRGKVRAMHIAYCTNGYTGHLLPQIRGGLYPLRGIMTVQELYGNRQPPNRGATWSWSIHHQPVVDEESQNTSSSIYYLQQNASTGQYFFGGADEEPARAITGDDTKVSSSGVKHLQAKLSHFLAHDSTADDRLISSWSGIMGFTSDGNPLVDRLPQSITNRTGAGEWIAAGFNGMGMSLCVSSGEALAHLILGKDVTSWLPEAFGVTEERLQQTLNAQKAVEAVKSDYPSGGGKQQHKRQSPVSKL